MDIATLIQNAADGDNVGASTIFDELMATKVNDALEAEKVKMADVVFNGATDEDPEIEDEDLEDDKSESDEEEDEEDEDES
jgi:ribosomal protein L12E/L44/L45/RPP1/RPP2